MYYLSISSIFFIKILKKYFIQTYLYYINTLKAYILILTSFQFIFGLYLI